jgi:hypothetical protein
MPSGLMRWKVALDVMKIVQSQSDLLQVVFALKPPRGFAG